MNGPARPGARTVIDKIWDEHRIVELGAHASLLAIDRVLLHERTGPALLAALAAAGRAPRDRERVFGCLDHVVDTRADRAERGADHGPALAAFAIEFRRRTRDAGITLFDLADARQGIVHVVAPEQGIALPGCTLVCPDSHTGTVGGLGALAWGIGSTEGEHAVATMTLARPHARRMRVAFDGRLPPGTTAKDMALALIARHGAGGGDGCAIEFAGAAVRGLDIEGRMSLCNMAVEFGAWTGLVAPDERTIEWIAGRRYAPAGALFERAAAHWRTLASDDGAAWDAQLTFDVSALAPQVSWGTSPEHCIAIDAGVPAPDARADTPVATPPDTAPAAPDDPRRAGRQAALRYMGLKPGQPLLGLPIQAAFIGSCTNSRLPDLRAAAALLRGRQVAAGVHALVVPGSMAVRAAAEAEGLDRVFEAAGFEWRKAGCSLCFYAGVDRFELDPAGPRRVISSTNRNFEGRQGPGVRTHLASPLTVAASAIAGCIADPRPLLAATR